MGLDNFLFVTPAVALEYMLCNIFLLKPREDIFHRREWDTESKALVKSMKQAYNNFFFLLSDWINVYKMKIASVVLLHVHSEMKLSDFNAYSHQL